MAFPVLWDIDEKTYACTCDEANHVIGIWLKRNTHTLEKFWVPISQVLPNGWICPISPMLWNIEWKTYVYSSWWIIPSYKNLVKQKHPYLYHIGINFPGSSHKICFVAFFHVIGYWCEDLYIPFVTKQIIGLGFDGRKPPILWYKYRYHFFSPMGGFAAFPMLMNIDWKTYAFPLWLTTLFFL